jgi:hypothetical protein
LCTHQGNRAGGSQFPNYFATTLIFGHGVYL